METNPYAPPQVSELSAPLSATAEAEAIRQAHIKTEATVKSVGTLYYLGMFLLGVVGVMTLVSGFGQSKGEDIGLGIFFLVISIAQGFLAYGLRRLRSWARWPSVVLSMIGLLGFPMGTIINVVILFSLLGAKANMVFSPAYKEIIAATPQVKYKSSVVVVVLLVILVLILIGVVASVMMG
ncbi:MAG: hypothetical protein V4662_04820 [Verrucomicrobiota bacterium]